MGIRLPTIRRLGVADIAPMRALNALFADAFEDPASYAAHSPGDAWLADRLGRAPVIALVGEIDGAVVGGLVAYMLDKLEQERRELYIYDLAVAAAHRRRGLATGLIAALRAIAAKEGAWVIFVQADVEDAAAVALYSKLGSKMAALQFDIAVAAQPA